MNKREKEVIQSQLDKEKAVLKKLENQYQRALNDIINKTKILQADIDMLQTAGEADDKTLSMVRSKVYQKQYQQALQQQITGILDKLHSDEYSTIQGFLNGCYEDGFIGTMYALQGQGIPIIAPIDTSAAVKAVQLDSKVVEGYYKHLGVDFDRLKKVIPQEVSRGIASSRSYSDIARNLNNASKSGLYNAKRIARTEGHRIQQQSAEDARQVAKKKGADVVKQWDASLDSRTRDSHRRVDGEIRESDEKFSNGLMYAGDPNGSAAEVINCRCVTLTRARWALDEEELNTLKERAEYFGLDKTENFEDYKKKYLQASEQVTKAESATDVVKNKFGDAIIFDEKLGSEKWAESVKHIKDLSNEYNTRLTTVKVGASQAAGSVDMGGNMRLSSIAPDVAFHEFAHSVAIENLTKYGVTDDADFWKEIKAVRRAYRKNVGDDSSRWISAYEHSNKSVDEFMAEAFTQAKMIEKGIDIPTKYGTDTTYSNKVLEIIDKYFKKPLENSKKSSTMNTKQISSKIKGGTTVVNPMNEAKYNKLKSNLEKQGIHVIQAEGDDLRYLQALGAEASYGNGYIMHIGSVPSASGMYEEIIHSTQAKKYGEFLDSDPVELYAREIAANRKLLRNGKAYGFDETDFEDIERNLSSWEKKFTDLVGVSYDESDYSREI